MSTSPVGVTNTTGATGVTFHSSDAHSTGINSAGTSPDEPGPANPMASTLSLVPPQMASVYRTMSISPPQLGSPPAHHDSLSDGEVRTQASGGYLDPRRVTKVSKYMQHTSSTHTTGILLHLLRFGARYRSCSVLVRTRQLCPLPVLGLEVVCPPLRGVPLCPCPGGQGGRGEHARLGRREPRGRQPQSHCCCWHHLKTHSSLFGFTKAVVRAHAYTLGHWGLEV